MPIDAAISLGQAKKTTAPPTSVTNAACDNMQKRMRESSHFDQPVPFGKEGFDPRQQRLEPIQQGLAARIAHSQPNDDGSAVAALALTILEILVLGDNDRANLLRMVPDFRIGRRLQPQIGHMFRCVTAIVQQSCERRRQLGIDHESHESPGQEHGMIRFPGRKFEAGHYILGFQIGVVLQDLLL